MNGNPLWLVIVVMFALFLLHLIQLWRLEDKIDDIQKKLDKKAREQQK